MQKRPVLIVVCLTWLCATEIAAPPKAEAPHDVQAAMDHIRADSLRGDLSFLASDLLEGRNTPSRGLDIAAEFIAAQFRRAGLEPGGEDGYYQTAQMMVAQENLDGFELKLSGGGHSFSADPKNVSLMISAALDLSDTPLFKLDLADSALVQGLAPEQLDGKVVITQRARGNGANFRAASAKLRQAKPAVILVIGRSEPREGESAGKYLVDPEIPPVGAARIMLSDKDAAHFYGALKAGLSDATASIHVAAPRQTAAPLHNVIGILRGSDPVLKDTCILLTAHYDHIGKLPDGPGHRIYNGANDDGSGTVSVIEIARALAALEPHPRRSIVFVAFFGEEEGMFGSRYYARHPAWPIEKTVAQLNLEQVGRTDSSNGPEISNATLTGFDYSNLSDYLSKAGRLAGIKLYKDDRNSDLYFSQSDNIYLAQVGVPAETLTVAFEFPDYHGLGDEWQKIDYGNMAKVDRMIAGALVMMANSDEAPRWNEKNPKVAPYLKAWQQRHP